MRGQQIVEPEVVERRPERHREKPHRPGEAPDPPARRPKASDGEQVEQRQGRDDDRRIDVRLPGIRRVEMCNQHRG
jgi:hypothetical protein